MLVRMVTQLCMVVGWGSRLGQSSNRQAFFLRFWFRFASFGLAAAVAMFVLVLVALAPLGLVLFVFVVLALLLLALHSPVVMCLRMSSTSLAWACNACVIPSAYEVCLGSVPHRLV